MQVVRIVTIHIMFYWKLKILIFFKDIPVCDGEGFQGLSAEAEDGDLS